MYTSRVKRRIILIFAATIVFLMPPPTGGTPPLGASGGPYLREFRAGTPILPSNELRAAWVVRHTLVSKTEIDRAIDFAVRARFHLLFVQVRGRGDAYYRSTLEPVADEIEAPIDDFDPLEYFIVRAHAQGIAVHAWVNMCYVWSDPNHDPPPGHILLQHPDWLMGDSEGHRMDALSLHDWKGRGIEGYYVSPAIPDMREHTVAVIKDIVDRYSVDGVHLDYIRYPNGAFGYNDFERTAFKLRYGVDPLRLQQERYGIDLVLGERATHMLDSLHVEWRSAQVDTLVRMTREAVGHLPLSAAVVPEFGRAESEKGQDWLGWVQRGYLDFVVPMAYTYEPADLVDHVRLIKRLIGEERFLVGLPVYDGRETYLGYSVSLLRQEGVLGYSLFSYNALAEQSFAVQFLDRVFLEPFRPEPEADPDEEE